MFDIGFTELLLIAIVALVVLGPERLPRVARTAGHLLGRFQRYATQVKSDISREMQLDDLKKMQVEMAETASRLQASITTEMSAVESEVNRAREGVEAEAQKVEASITPPLDAIELERAAHAVDGEVAQMQDALARSLAVAAPQQPTEATQAPSAPATPDTGASPKTVV